MDNVFRFACFEADRARYQLWCESRPIKLERIPLELLFLLLENRGKLVSRTQIVATIWDDKSAEYPCRHPATELEKKDR